MLFVYFTLYILNYLGRTNVRLVSAICIFEKIKTNKSQIGFMLFAYFTLYILNYLGRTEVRLFSAICIFEKIKTNKGQMGFMLFAYFTLYILNYLGRTEVRLVLRYLYNWYSLLTSFVFYHHFISTHKNSSCCRCGERLKTDKGYRCRG